MAIKIGSTTVIDNNKNLTNIGTISATGAISSNGIITASGGNSGNWNTAYAQRHSPPSGAIGTNSTVGDHYHKGIYATHAGTTDINYPLLLSGNGGSSSGYGGTYNHHVLNYEPDNARLRCARNYFSYDSTTDFTHQAVNTASSFSGTVSRDYVSGNTSNHDFDFYVARDGNSANQIRFTGAGRIHANGAYQSSGADYAEFFEWEDGNPDNDDRRGISVVLEGEKIRPANSTDKADDIIGAISAAPSAVGRAASFSWDGKFKKDKFGANLIVNGTGVVSDNWDRSLQHPDDGAPNEDPSHRDYNKKDPKDLYKPREKRKEWDTVGLVGCVKILKSSPKGSRWLKMSYEFEDVEEWLIR